MKYDLEAYFHESSLEGMTIILYNGDQHKPPSNKIIQFTTENKGLWKGFKYVNQISKKGEVLKILGSCSPTYMKLGISGNFLPVACLPIRRHTSQCECSNTLKLGFPKRGGEGYVWVVEW